MARFDDSARIAGYERDHKRLMERIESYGVEEIGISRLKIDEEAAQFKEKEAVEILSDSFKRRKRMLNFPIVQKGSYLVISGTHRVMAAKVNGEKTILCRMVDVDDTELWAIRIEENLTRRKTRPKELYYWFKKARDEWGWTQDIISSLVGLSRGRVAQILSWGDKGSQGVAGDTRPELLETNISESPPSDIPPTVDSGPMSVPEVPTHGEQEDVSSSYVMPPPPPAAVSISSAVGGESAKSLRNRYLQDAFAKADEGDQTVLEALNWEQWWIRRKLLAFGVEPFDPKNENPET